jgi:exopolyphosphatase/guanosine-5'-triphosphate,3'-diphosphate pyrophosphatase
MQETIAIIDLGTNTFHLLLVERNERDEFTVKGKFKEAVKLGEGGITSGVINPEAFERGLKALQVFRKLIDSSGVNRTFAFATSAIRSARNGKAFVKAAKEQSNIDVKVINGNEEAALIHEGVKNGVQLPQRKPVLLLDIGGGSVEFIVSEGGIPLLLRSLNIGAARLLENIQPSDPLTLRDREALVQLLEQEMGSLLGELKEFDIELLVGSSGSCETIASLVARANGDVLSASSLNGYRFGKKQFVSCYQKLVSSSRAERLDMPGMDPLRADMIVMASSLCQFLISQLKIKQFMVSTSALKEGIFFRYLRDERQRMNEYLGAADRSLRAKAVQNLARRYDFDSRHGVQVSALATELFQQTQDLHQLGPHELELMQYAAALHDIGRYLNPSGHHKHGQYIIMNSELPGFSTNELVMVANLVRYHRKSLPKRDHFHYKILPSEKQRMVKWLGGILRIADNLDRGHRNLVNGLQVHWDDATLYLQVRADEDVSIEVGHAMDNRQLLEVASGRSVKISLSNGK